MTELFGVEMTPQAEDDLERLFEFLVAGSETLEELDHAQHVLHQLRTSIKKRLAENPWAYRKAGDGRRTTRRELIAGLGSTGYVALYEILPGREVKVLAVRHQREEDYH
ncbi:type II toxin-antitoxin system RelE/ParE family toxin [Variovorax saccharolyticus]|uniref:type II toxin-antitoxin system RelE/ParE family toxin n=1 Tax=Variovorax saccharolyticus TaxID=3053516 RepID=UPI0025754D1D|nr:type II toxin-antitoxin system RelE/ParE family toxin [Variovorax sp. J31P216]MDM0026233.1 type II toxin-antitoxin system RelE/ParE family toxin [Variovorax sp. J31P216]